MLRPSAVDKLMIFGQLLVLSAALGGRLKAVQNSTDRSIMAPAPVVLAFEKRLFDKERLQTFRARDIRWIVIILRVL